MTITSIAFPANQRFIDPLTDFGFKYLLGSEPNKEIMIEFLNTIFNGQKNIVDLVFSPTEHVASTDENKKVFFDLMCTGSAGEQFIIEMQRIEHGGFRERCIYYLSRLISEQLPKGESDWDRLKEVYLIAVLDFKFRDKDDERFLNDIVLMNKDTGKVFYDKFGFKFLELPNFEKGVNELSSDLDKWFYILKNMSRMEQVPSNLNERIFKKLFKIAEVSKLTKEQRKLYESNLKAKWDYEHSLAWAKKEAGEKARIEGLESGRQEGIQEGRQEGIEEGRLNERSVIALELKEAGMSVDQISKMTKLSIEEIEKL
jgi:predicted transposase/invertase (TIGR01784 family)